MQAEGNVLILTPVKDAEPMLPRYFDLLRRLTYPRDRLSVAFLESDSEDGTYDALARALPGLRELFRSAQLFKKDFGFRIPRGVPRWASSIQLKRRAVLARSRNHLLFRALADEDWVLWVDVDVVDCPPDVIERLLAAGRDIVHPHCVREGDRRTFDLNAWRDRGRLHMQELRREGELARLHAVGGTMLLVRADVHRDGLIFPPFLYGNRSRLIRGTNHFGPSGRIRRLLARRSRGEIETEGLGIMAYDMGLECWGMPGLEIVHANR